MSAAAARLVAEPDPAALTPAELACYRAAARRLARGVDVGPGAALALCLAVQRLSRQLAAVEALAYSHSMAGTEVPVAELHRAAS